MYLPDNTQRGETVVCILDLQETLQEDVSTTRYFRRGTGVGQSGAIYDISILGLVEECVSSPDSTSLEFPKMPPSSSRPLTTILGVDGGDSEFLSVEMGALKENDVTVQYRRRLVISCLLKRVD